MRLYCLATAFANVVLPDFGLPLKSIIAMELT